ncbi:MAG: phosphoribosyl-ATP diphosphatase [Gammaproteobacteria bacterium]|nr:phosphoribosyl-ATP diphosphatase [Gammaproteobacteria bacterium]
MEAPESVLLQLSDILEKRKGSDPETSYASHLFAAGTDTILQKVGEESIEFILAAKGGDQAHLVSEAADVWFHMLVLLSEKGLSAQDILNELNRRLGTSGITEKASRGN